MYASCSSRKSPPSSHMTPRKPPPLPPHPPPDPRRARIPSSRPVDVKHEGPRRRLTRPAGSSHLLEEVRGLLQNHPQRGGTEIGQLLAQGGEGLGVGHRPEDIGESSQIRLTLSSRGSAGSSHS